MDTSRHVSRFRGVKTKKKERSGRLLIGTLLLAYDCDTEHNSDYEYENRDKQLVQETRTFYTFYT